MMTTRQFTLFAITTLLALGGNAHRILGLFPIPIRSHYAFYEKLMMALAQRGHDVDVLTHFPRANAIPKLKQLSVAGSMHTLENNISLATREQPDFWTMAGNMADLSYTSCRKVLRHPVIGELKTSKKKYDVVITEMYISDCLVPLAHFHSAPIIGISSTAAIMPWTDERMGNPDNPAYISNYFLPWRGRIPFGEKLYSTFVNIASRAWYHVMVTIPAEIRGQEVFGNVPTIEKLAQQTVLYLANRHFVLDGPRPLVPGVVEIGGMHLFDDSPQPIKPLELEKFLDKSNSGVIYFSMGTLINLNTLIPSFRELIKFFSDLKQNVVINIDPKILEKNQKIPDNIYLGTNLPQIGVLCHPKTKLFITHGGALGVQEAAYCGVPILGIPVYPNHEVNIKNYIHHGAGLHLPYSELNESSLRKNISAILEDKMYQEQATKLAGMYKDRPTKPLDTAIYWIEYVLKHGGRHMRSASADLIFFEYLLVDVVLVGIALAVIGFYLFYRMLQFLQDLFDRPPPPKIHKEKETEKENKKE